MTQQLIIRINIEQADPSQHLDSGVRPFSVIKIITALLFVLSLAALGFYLLSGDTGSSHTKRINTEVSTPSEDVDKHKAPTPAITETAQITPDTSSTTTNSTPSRTPRNANQNLLSDYQSTIIDARVKRFVLVPTVKNKEPKGNLNQLRFDANGFTKIYAYSEILDHKDHRLSYRWSYLGKKQASVKVSVWSDSWRSHSSKLIKRNQTGRWKLELRNGAGTVLAESEFTINAI